MYIYIIYSSSAGAATAAQLDRGARSLKGAPNQGARPAAASAKPALRSSGRVDGLPPSKGARTRDYRVAVSRKTLGARPT